MDKLITDDGWEPRPEYAAYVKAINRIRDFLGGKKYADRSFFLDAPDYYSSSSYLCDMFIKHVSTIVQSEEILVYLVAGNPHLA